MASKSKPGGDRRTVRLNLELEKSLSAYASAAVAAGVSLLATTRSAEASVVYTPSNESIPVNESPVLVDLNHDGIADFALWNLRYIPHLTTYEIHLNLYAGCAPAGSTCQNPGNEIWGRGVGSLYGRFASALSAGSPVGPNASYFQQSPKRKYGTVLSPIAQMAKIGMYYNYEGYLSGSNTAGQWLYTQYRYLGLQFIISGEMYYGWARVAVTRNGNIGIVATLTGYAYETVANKPIIAGQTKESDEVALEPSALGRLAQGASGVSAWRGQK